MGKRITISIDDEDSELQPKLVSAAHLMNDDEEDDESGEPAGLADSDEESEDGERPAPRKGATVAGGKKGPIPPQFVKAMRARKTKEKGK